MPVSPHAALSPSTAGQFAYVPFPCPHADVTEMHVVRWPVVTSQQLLADCWGSTSGQQAVQQPTVAVDISTT